MLFRLVFFCGFFLYSYIITLAQPDTLTNRYAGVEDAAYWHNVNEGDYIFFTGNIDNGHSIYAGGTVFKVSLDVGKKILIWRGSYKRILLDGALCSNSEEQPTIITNLGGQVKWGYSEDQNGYRTFDLLNFDHVYLTGKHDPVMQTGHEDFTGHDAGRNLGNANYYQKYGLWGNPKWSGYRFNNSFSNVVRISKFTSCKIDYVAATEGGFAGFNVKTDNPDVPKRVKIDIQDCFAGWVESEAFYISFSSRSEGQDLTQLIFRNNMAVFCGAESIQTDNLTEGTVLENNIAFAGACFYRRPFQDLFQDGLHQLSFVEGGVTVRNNVFITGNSLHQIRYKNPGPGRAFPSADKEVRLENNYYGFARSNISYIWEGDGITPYVIEDNIYGPVSTPTSRDAYLESSEWNAYLKVCNTSNPITYLNCIFPPGRDFFIRNDCGTSHNVDTLGLTSMEAPLLDFVNSGFSNDYDYRNITFWSAQYTTADKRNIYIPYNVGDIVFYFNDNGETGFFKCSEPHAANYNPFLYPEYWEQIFWNNENLPPLDLRLKNGSFYETRDIGLSYKEHSTSAAENVENISNLLLYPNPANAELYISLPEGVKRGDIIVSIFSATGQSISTKTETFLDGQVCIDTTNLVAGFYILSINSGDETYMAKFLIQ